MTPDQWKVFEGIVNSCKSNEQSSVNIGSKKCRDAIIAVHEAMLNCAIEHKRISYWWSYSTLEIQKELIEKGGMENVMKARDEP